MARNSSSKYWKIPIIVYVRKEKGKKRPKIDVLSVKDSGLVMEANGRRLKRQKLLKIQRKTWG